MVKVLRCRPGIANRHAALPAHGGSLQHCDGPATSIPSTALFDPIGGDRRESWRRTESDLRSMRYWIVAGPGTARRANGIFRMH
jgi:hypothetical protein